MKIEITGLQKKQKEIADLILKSSAKFHIINASRQSGKTYLLSYLTMIFSLFIKDNILIVSPTYEMSRIIFDRVISNENYRKEFVFKIKESKPYEIETKTGTVIKFRSAERIDTLRGLSNKIVLIDEYAFTKDDLMNLVIRPSTAAKTNSKILVFSTPKGKQNDFYNLAFTAISGDDNYKYYQMSYTDNSFYDLSEIEDAKLRLPSNIFRQEYLAEFIENSGDVFDNFDNISTISQYKPFKQNEPYFAGIDFGRADDSTVLTILNKDKEVVYINSWVKLPWNVIVDELTTILKMYKPIAYAECNSIGDVLISNIKQKYGSVKEFLTTNNSKKEIIEKLRFDIYSNNILLPTSKLCPALNNELASYTYTLNKTGTISYHHSSNSHDDHIDSLAIANYAFDNHNNEFKNIKFIPKPNSIYNTRSIYK